MYAHDGEAGGDNGRSAPRTEGRGNREDGYAPRTPRPPRSDYARPPAPSRDPFFDKPYEPTAVADKPAASWEATARPASRSISANIKPKRKVAALFKTE
jgi:hypothetical protein